MDMLNGTRLAKSTISTLKKFNFLDNRGRHIRQFKVGSRIDATGRLGTILTLARMDVAKRHVASIDSEINEAALEQELNDAVLAKMYEMFQKANGGDISDKEYTDALSLQVNATAGWCARIKGKLGRADSQVGDFYERVFSRQRRFDKLANVRMAPSVAKEQVKRIDLFKRILKGFASAFIASALITVIASAAAAAAGISLAVSMAAIGVITGLGLSIAQVIRWRKKHPDATIQDFLGDTRLITSLGVSAIAMAAMCFGAAGMAVAAKSLGYGAIALGGTKNTVEMFRDARASGKSVAESLAWGIATAIAVAGGGFAGRAAGRGAVDWFNKHNPENTTFQNAEEHHAQREVIDEQHEVSRTTTEYPDGMVERAENAVRQWYAARYPNNPEILQQNIDAVNQYNIDHGTDLNPWTTLRAMAYAGNPNHGIYTGADWQNTYGYTPEQINAAAHAINPDGTYNAEGMAILNDLQVHHMDALGHVGATNHFRNTTYSPLGETPTQTTETHTETTSHMEDYVDRIDHTPTNDEGMAAFGNYTPKFAQVGRKLRDRVGRFMERVRGNDGEDSSPMQPKPSEILPVLYDDTDSNLPEILPVRDEDVIEPDNELHEIPAPKEPLGLLTDGQVKTDLVPTPRLPRLQELLNKDENQIKIKPREQKLLGPGDTQGLMPVPNYEEANVEQELRLGVEYSDAKHWEVLNQNIAREMSKKRPDYKKIDTWKQELRQLYNKLGRPDMTEFEIARTDAFRRHNLEEAIHDYEKYIAKRPQPGTVSAKTLERWEKKRQQLKDRIERLGGVESLDTSHLYFPVPVESESRKRKEEKWARLDAEKAERDASIAAARAARGTRGAPVNPRVENACPISPIAENPFDIPNPKPTVQDAPNVGSVLHPQPRTEQPVQNAPRKVAPTLPRQITDIRGVPVEPVSIDNNNNYMGQYNGVPIILTNVGGIYVAFYLDSERHTWRPVYRVDVEQGVFVDAKAAGCPEIVKIVAALNEQMGIDYSTADLPLASISMLCNKLANTEFWDPQIGNYRSPYDGNEYHAVVLYPNDLYRGLSLVEDPNRREPRRWPFRFLDRFNNDDSRK